LNKSSIKGAKYLRINADGHHDTYKLGDTVTLLKEGDPLPIFNFSKEGFRDTTYTMKDEREVVLIHMTPGVNDPVSSSSEAALSSAAEPASSAVIIESSSSEAVSSSSVIDCASKTLKNDTEIMVDGRKVIVKFPNGYTGDKPVPMLINYHQIFGSASDWVNDAKIGKVALADGAISIYPDGAETPNGEMGQAWNVGPCCTTADDVTFTRNFIKELTEKACVDPKRIYAAGWSMGGGMSNYAGCVLADVIAAAAPSAFDLTKEVIDAGKCNPARPFPILNFRSTNDGVVSYGGGLSQIIETMPITFLGAEPTFAKWAELNHCSGNYVEKDGCRYYENCEGGAVVGLCILNTDHNEGDPQKAWNFLKQFSIQ
jgi:polyhydroxybutyrate depolymerase